MLWWITVIVILLHVAFVERKSFSSIGFRRPSVSTLLIGAVTGVLMVIGVITIFFRYISYASSRGQQSADGKHFLDAVRYRVLLVTRAAVAEEVLFRGYPIERIQEWTGNRFIAALISGDVIFDKPKARGGQLSVGAVVESIFHRTGTC